MNGESSDANIFTSHVGAGSSSQFLLAACEMRRWTVVSAMGLNASSRHSCTNSKLVWVEIVLQVVDPKDSAHLGANRLKVKPITIDRKPPDFLLRDRRRPPNNTGATSDGQRPAKTKLKRLSERCGTLVLPHGYLASHEYVNLGTQVIRAAR